MGPSILLKERVVGDDQLAVLLFIYGSGCHSYQSFTDLHIKLAYENRKTVFNYGGYTPLRGVLLRASNTEVRMRSLNTKTTGHTKPA